MKFELDLVRASGVPDTSANATRKELREITDELIHSALLVNDLPELVRLSAETMCIVARALVRFENDPQVPDFVEASQALIEQGRAVMDRGLMLGSPETINCGAVMLELTVRGICAALSVPYDQVLIEVHRARCAGENPLVRPILVDAGLVAPLVDEPAPVQRTCTLCGYSGTAQDHIGQCPQCHWDELDPPPGNTL